MVELLAPAGNLERLKFAFLYGADAVYVGGINYSMRSLAKNFTNEELKTAVLYAHSLNKKLYVTVNIVFHEYDDNNLVSYLKYLSEINVDAIIISDVFIIDLVKEHNINLELHLSTQASILNSESAKFYKDLRIKRIVLARESSKNDIQAIKDATDMDLEAFIHGSMCVSFSGRCVMSNYATLRDSNRGACAQVCRWVFDYTKSNNKVIDIPFSMSPKDLNMVPFIEDMINVGVNSFKIEGRMRSIYYVATVILIYRRLIDKILNNTLTDKYKEYSLNILNRVANRESTPQFYDKLPGSDEQYYLGRQELSNQDFLGLVIDVDDDFVVVEERNYFEVGDIVQFFGPNIKTFDYQIKVIYDENMKEIKMANHAQMIVKLKIDKKLYKYSMMRKKIFDICD